MQFIINHSSMEPIYEQIMGQIRSGITKGTMKEGDALPSVRMLAKDLKVSALTVKKAYDGLEQEGFIMTVHGKGSFVTCSGQDIYLEERRREVEEELAAAVRKGRSCGMDQGGTAGIISDGIGGTVMIRLEQAEKQYKNFHLDCSMEVQEGMVTGLIGPNGAGKSTTFRLLTGLAKPEAGRVEIFGKEISELTAEDRRKIGVVWSDAGFSGYLMGKDLIAVLKNMYPAFDEGWFQKKCEEFHLPMDKKLKDFSTGMKAKLKVLSAVANGDARLLILDEPTAGMDVMVREQILDLLREFMMPGDRSILISSHISSDLEGFCDDVYLMNQGKIILHEDVDTLLEQYGILKVTTEQYDTLDKEYLLRVKKEDYGYACLTGQKDFYQENWPQIIVEKGTIDQIMTMMVEGK